MECPARCRPFLQRRDWAVYRYTGSREDTDFSTFANVELDGFGLLDLRYSRKFNDATAFFVAVDNVFDTDYVEVIGFTTRGRNVRAGLTVRFF